MSDARDTRFRSVVALSGGVGGARFLHGLSRALPHDALTAIVNTGDDFRHLGLYVAPDLDTVMYTLADVVHVERGWGLADETFGALEMIRRYGGDGWFQIGDRDLGTHLVRSQWLAAGRTLTEITAQLCGGLGVATRVLPMCDEPRRTIIETASHGTLPFQDWFVRLGAPAVRRVSFEGARTPTSSCSGRRTRTSRSTRFSGSTACAKRSAARRRSP
jgi:LPPG:FO 2-phospho-L-lactate transferase